MSHHDIEVLAHYPGRTDITRARGLAWTILVVAAPVVVTGLIGWLMVWYFGLRF